MKRIDKKSLLIIPCSLLALSSCGEKPLIADTIVYGDSIYTANLKGDTVEAFAIKDGKYIAVGGKKDVDKHLGKDTKTHTVEFAMPGAIESHGHWILEQAFKKACYIDGAENFSDIIDILKDYRSKNMDKDYIYAYGWDFFLHGTPDIALLNQEFPDIPVYVLEKSLHGAFGNHKCFELAGVLAKDPEGIKIERDDQGNVLGIARDEAITYIQNKVFGPISSGNEYKSIVKETARYMNSLGYTAHYDMWSNFDGTKEMYKAIHDADVDGDLNFLFSTAYCVEAYEKNNSSEIINEAVNLKKTYQTKHFYPNYVKLFADGVIETGTGYVSEPYVTESLGHGTKIWEEEKMKEIVDEANRKGMLIHVHTMGDKAVSEAVDAFIDSESHNGYHRNSIGHVAQCSEADLVRIKEHNIGVSSGAYWACQTSMAEIAAVSEFINEQTFRNLYPCKEFLDHNIKAALHTDNPCTSGILDLFGYIQVLVNGIDHKMPLNENTFTRRNNFISLREAIDMYTYNGAWMNNLENERGSIEVGKYADFIFTDKDPFKQDINEIYQIKVTDTFFEGNNVYHRQAD